MITVTHGIRVEEDKCIGCRICELVCPTLAITMLNRKPRIELDSCSGCGNCVSRCPTKCMYTEKRTAPVVWKTDVSSVDRLELEELCEKAGFNSEQVVCFCTGTRAKELAAATLKGAKTSAEIARMTGIRSGCTVECSTAPLRFLKAAGIKLEKGPGWQWYGLTPTIWDIPASVRQKHAGRGFYFDDDEKLLTKLAARKAVVPPIQVIH